MAQMLAILMLIHIEASLFSSTTAVTPACECIVYGGQDGSGRILNGTFMSPNYPVPYPKDVHCLLYSFLGSDNEFVEIMFQHLHLSGKKGPDGKCLDFVRIFHDLDSSGVDEKSPWQIELCGRMAPPEITFYSKDRFLIFEFHSDKIHNPTTDRGFIGEFRFLEKRNYLTDGQKVRHAGCYYHIKSSEDLRRGKIYSPRYPYHYPPNSDCYYWLQAQPGERIRITMKERDLQAVDGSCVYAQDQVLIFDGMPTHFPGKLQKSRRHAKRFSSRQSFHFDSERKRRIRERRADPKSIGLLCGKSTAEDSVISSGQNAYIHFRGGENKDLQGRGFWAEYEFVTNFDELTAPGIKLPSSSIGIAPNLDLETESCDQRFDSSGGLTGGTVYSPNYNKSGGYPSDRKCTYTFHSFGRQRVQLIFTDFDLYLPPKAMAGDPRKPECRDNYDHFTAYVELEGRMSKIDTFCGVETPLQIMSSSNTLIAEFISHSHRNNEHKDYRGFSFMYRFVQNFGITVGDRDTREGKPPCAFVFNSNESSNGTVYSPNYPGFYPRKTDCHYEFHGNKDQRISLHFTYFDVEGYEQCDNQSQSDYVLFSNYQTEDKKNERYCGVKRPGKIVSEENFFRMLFHSNNIFDGAGFFALYQFSEPPPPAIRSVRTTSSAGVLLPVSSKNCTIVISAIFLLLLRLDVFRIFT